jgi:hypothetical protein
MRQACLVFHCDTAASIFLEQPRPPALPVLFLADKSTGSDLAWANGQNLQTSVKSHPHPCICRSFPAQCLPPLPPKHNVSPPLTFLAAFSGSSSSASPPAAAAAAPPALPSCPFAGCWPSAPPFFFFLALPASFLAGAAQPSAAEHRLSVPVAHHITTHTPLIKNCTPPWSLE